MNNGMDKLLAYYKLIINLGVNTLFIDCNILTKSYHKLIFYNVTINYEELTKFQEILNNINNEALDINGYCYTYNELRKWNTFYFSYVTELTKHLCTYKDELNKNHSIQTIIKLYTTLSIEGYKIITQTNNMYYNKLRNYIKIILKEFNKYIDIFYNTKLIYDIDLLNKLGYLCKKLIFSKYLFKEIPIKDRKYLNRDKRYCYYYTTMIKIMATHNISLYDYLIKELKHKEINEENLLRRTLGNKYLEYIINV